MGPPQTRRMKIHPRLRPFEFDGSADHKIGRDRCGARRRNAMAQECIWVTRRYSILVAGLAIK